MCMRTACIPALLAFLILVGCSSVEGPLDTASAGKTQPPPVTQSPSPSLLVDDWGGYEVAVPEGWRLKDHTHTKNWIRADLVRSKTCGLQIRVYRDNAKPFDAFVDDFAETFIEEMEGHWGGEIREESRRFGAIGIHDGCRMALVHTRRDGQEWLFLEYLWPREDRVVLFQCGTLLEDRYSDEPSLDNLAATFRFLP